MEILYVDNHLLVVIKPPGTLSQGDHTGEASLLDEAREWVRIEFNKPGNVFLGLVHRLDRNVGGVMVFARTSKAAARLSAQFRNRTVEKVYRAVLEGQPPAPDGLLTDTLDGKECTLSYRVLSASGRATGSHDPNDRGFGGRSELEIRPKTGRKHQIRRQVALAGCPIVGDVRYGAKSRLADRRMALRAAVLTLEHPTQKRRMTFEAPEPPWWPRLG